MGKEERRLREELARYGRKAAERGLVCGNGGNISGRLGDRILISPTGAALDELEPGDFLRVPVGAGGKDRPEPGASSESGAHLACYRMRPEVGGVLHSHPPVMLGLLAGGVELPAMTPEFVAYAGAMTVIPYFLPSSGGLAAALEEAARGHDVICSKNHGIFALGPDARMAFFRSIVLETTARIYLVARLAGKAEPLSREQVAEVLELVGGGEGV